MYVPLSSGTGTRYQTFLTTAHLRFPDKKISGFCLYRYRTADLVAYLGGLRYPASRISGAPHLVLIVYRYYTIFSYTYNTIFFCTGRQQGSHSAQVENADGLHHGGVRREGHHTQAQGAQGDEFYV